MSRHKPEKSWGHEEWIVNNEWYCGKRLHFTKSGGQTSLHFHKNKHETMYVEKGSFTIVIVDITIGMSREYYLNEGDSLVIDRLVPHRIIANSTPSILVEFSTHHEDADSYRVER